MRTRASGVSRACVPARAAGWACAAWALLLRASVSLAGDTGVVAGQVFDRETQRPLPFAIVIVHAFPDVRGTMVDGEGRFLIPGVPGGSWRLEARALGYERVVESIPVGAAETTLVTVSLPARADSLSPSARRAGPKAPFLVTFPGQPKLEAEGLVGAWYSQEFPRSVGFTADGMRLALETRSGVTVFRVDDVTLAREHVLRYPAPDSGDLQVALGWDGLLRVRRGNGGPELVAEPDAGLAARPVRRLNGAGAPGREWCFFSPDRRLVAVREPGRSQLGIWQLPEAKRVADVSTSLQVSCVAFPPGSNNLVVGGRGRAHAVEIHDLEAGRLRAVIPLRGETGIPRTLVVDPQGRHFIAGDDEHALACWGLADLGLRWRLVPETCCAGEFLELSPDGSLLVTGSGSGLLLVEAGTGRVVRRVMTSHKRGIRGAAFRPDGKVLATIGYDSIVGLWDVKRLLAGTP